MRILRFAVFGLALALLAACGGQSVTPTTAPQQPTPTPTAPPNPAVTPEPTRLTLWLPDWMLLENPAAADALEQAIDDFSRDAGVEVEIIIKPPRGEGGLLDFLTASYPVAPGILPDVIALPYTDAEIAMEQDFLQPLDRWLDPALVEDLYPFAQNIALENEARFAIPFFADFEHLAFQLSALSEPPADWGVVLASEARYAFPAGGPEAVLTDALIVHYLSVLKDANNPRDEPGLRRLLDFYEMARTLDRVDESVVQAASAAETWPRGLQGEVQMAHTTANLWLADRDQTTFLRFGPIPTADSHPRYVARGWSFGMVTADEAREALSVQLIERLMAPEVLGAWSAAAHRLPARRSALAQWPADNYAVFASEALENATRPPPWSNDTLFTRNMHRAVLDVLSGAADAATAAANAAQSW
ncbi:MAG: hypothetical protein GXP42_03520 [Chloroflexi bacterium]|nr:hypothetical protein [Chloroflexota bacterium]